MTQSEIKSELKNPILDIAASFWADDRYRAFRVCYQSMRELDDLVDDLKSSPSRDDKRLRQQVQESIRQQLKTLSDCAGTAKNPTTIDPRLLELAEVIREFKIPLWPWRRLVEAMEFDLRSDGFCSFLEFSRYTRGAAVAPASIFIHLIGLEKTADSYRPAPVDIRQSARPLAMFSYLTHILRDFRRDFADGLDYFPTDWQDRYQISPQDRAAAAAGQQSANFTSLVTAYHQTGAWYRERAKPELLPVYPYLSPVYRFSLNLIWRLYSQIHLKISQAEFVLAPELIHPNSQDIFAAIIKQAEEENLDESSLERGMARIGAAKISTS